MNDIKLQSRLFFAIIGGLAGFFVILLAGFIFIRVLITHFFGTSLSSWENIIILGFVPALIILGAGIPAYALGATLWRSFLAGVVAMVVFVFIHISGGQINYAPFIWYETVAFIFAILIPIIITTIGKNRFQSAELATLLILAATFTGLRFTLPGKDMSVGFVVSLLAWIILPLVAAFFPRLEGGE